MKSDDSPDSANRIWEFVPSFKLKVVLTDFEYDQNIEEILNAHKRVEFIDEHIIEVDESTVGSKISRTFTKNITDSFSWGLSQTLGVSVAL